MKKWLTVTAAMLISFSVVAQEKVVLYNWADYIPDSVLSAFTKETGIKVEVATFDSNETMFAKLQLVNGKGYDLAVPTTYFIERMKRAGLIQPIDKTKLKNLGNLDPDLLNQSYDPDNQYSIPYLWGNTAIAVNTDEMDPSLITTWKDLWKPEFKDQILLLDDVRDIFLLGLKVKGFKNNTTNEDEIRQAYEALVDVTLWVDSFVISKGAENVDNAHQFIDFVLRPEMAKMIVESVGNSTPNKAAIPLLSEAMRNNPMVVPPEDVVKNGTYHHDLGAANAIYEKYWQMLKQIK